MQIDLSTLNGNNGFVINGINVNEYSGYSVSGAGDVNGDGTDDLIIGAWGADPNGVAQAGESYVVFGRATFGASLELSSLDGSNGFVINGIDVNDFSGSSVSGAGDVNGDDTDDLIIGAWTANPNGDSYAGESYVVFGSATFGASLELSSLDGSDGFVINGIDADDYSGWSVSGAGDVNGDDKDDLIIGAYQADPNGNSNAGESYVVFGNDTFGASVELSSLNGSNGFVINGINAFDDSGYSVSGAGDVNGDGTDDLIIGAYGAAQTGKSYVVFGHDTFGASLELSSLDGSNGFVINGIDANDRSGRSVSRAGDVNGDGTDDLIIGAFQADPNGDSYAGESYVVFGRDTFGASLELSSLDGSNGFVINGIDANDRSGYSVNGAGDVNGDGKGDLIIGAYQADPNGNSNAGESYVVFGRDTFGASFELAGLDSSNGFVINGIDANDLSGYSVSGAGDLNGDGKDDLIIGAYQASPNGDSYAGESYVVFGFLDEQPVINDQNFSLDENAASSTVVGTVVASSPHNLNYAIISGNTNNAFAINSGNGQITVNDGSQLNYEVDNSYSITVQASDGSLSDTATVTVNLNNVNEAPTVVNNQSFNVNENASNGTMVGTVSASDPDAGDTLSYSITAGNTNNVFAIDSNNGQLTVVDALDYEATPTYNLTVRVSSRGEPFPNELSSLDGSNGFVINGIDVNDYSGYSVSGAGDVNGDGKDDLIIGAWGADPNGNNRAGESYVVFGGDTFGASLELSSLDGSNGFVINGIDVDDYSGLAVSGAGDVNGDGKDDLIIGASQADPNGDSNAGESYVVFGSDTFGASFALASLNGSNGFVINGIDVDEYSGYAVSGAGDVNGDGKDDLIIGASQADPNGDSNAGESYVVFGHDTFGASLELSSLDGSNGFVINGIDANDFSGSSVSGAGDVNGDGKDDLIIGARTATPNGDSYAGESYVVFGRDTFGASLELSSLDGSNGFVINGIDADDYSGYSVSGAGDVNGDGKDDLIIGAYQADPNGNSNAGESYVVFGNDTFGAILELSSLNGSNGFVINGINAFDDSGYSVSGAGDVNGDGKADLIIGAYGAAQTGKSYVVFGGDTFGASLELSSLDDSTGFVINGVDTSDRSGYSVSSAGDVNGDGKADLIIGAYQADPNGDSNAGESYVVFCNSGVLSDSATVTVNLNPDDDRDELSSAAPLPSMLSHLKEAVRQVYEQVSKPLAWLQVWSTSKPNVMPPTKPLSATAQQLKAALESYAMEQDSMTGLARAKFKTLENHIQAALINEPTNEILLKRLQRELEKHESRYGHPESMSNIYQRLYGKPSQQRNNQVGFFKPALPQVATVVVPEGLIPVALPTAAPIAQLGKC